MRKQPSFWYSKGFVWQAWALWPLSVLYRLGRFVHCQIRRLTPYWAGVPVISIGNITVGGAGKTPLVLALAQHYAKKGEQVAVLSRGYGGNQTRPYQVKWEDDASTVGDEPLLLFRALAKSSVQVWVGKNRVALARRAEENGATLLILDDGFQYNQLARNVDVLVVDGVTTFGNGFCLPAGPLREPLGAVKRADFAVLLNSQEKKPQYHNVLAYRLNTHLAPAQVKTLEGKPLLAFAGLARPEKFFESLKQAGLNVVLKKPFPDHYPYKEKDFKMLLGLAKAHNAQLVTTRKDFVRLPSAIVPHVQVVDLILRGEDWENIIAEVDERIR